uniref:C-type lectin domain-containing protein n=1 Tax=Sinocyclocheilus anshuiensis TaxID=1608454 RepID=A0A671P4L1_9TELE
MKTAYPTKIILVASYLNLFNILICVPKMNEGLTGLKRHEALHIFKKVSLSNLLLTDNQDTLQDKFKYIETSMNWTTNYCRMHHIDLATVQSNENWTRLQEAADEKLFSGFAWIGLYNDINSWRWSYNEESLVFESWADGQPNNYGLGEECVAIFNNGAWFDFYCTDSRYFVCSGVLQTSLYGPGFH